MERNDYTPRISKGKFLVLKEHFGSSSDLIAIKTSKKKDTEEKIRGGLEPWMNNKKFNLLRSKLLDLVIIVYVNKRRMEKQDVDNIAKVVLDALKKPKNKDSEKRWLFKDDSQVVRLLVYKIPQKRSKEGLTDEFVISFREHSLNKQMILIEQKII